jgi:hypothetical protein
MPHSTKTIVAPTLLSPLAAFLIHPMLTQKIFPILRLSYLFQAISTMEPWSSNWMITVSLMGIFFS